MVVLFVLRNRMEGVIGIQYNSPCITGIAPLDPFLSLFLIRSLLPKFAFFNYG